ncbi:unnamed protein product [Paramecium primaurelia]|uniref:Uncharacterized protein n=1 Tax=Paramecium primaurelia TaxID=5886 RepID=A0A8S1QD58_PARPR|nr:unnamed protein product [Paramecium primaurelia]
MVKICMMDWNIQFCLDMFGYYTQIININIIIPYNIVYKTNLMFDHQIDASFYPYHLQYIYNMDYMRINVLAATAASAQLWQFHIYVYE